MGKMTKIEWCDSTLNILVGCAGCELFPNICYAAELVGRYAGQKGWPADFNKPELFLERLDGALKWPDLTGTTRPFKPWLNGRPRMIFLNDMGDAFSPATTEDQLRQLMPAFEQMTQSPHAWLMLTKWPTRMADFVAKWTREFDSLWPSNVWLGISATCQATFDARVHALVHRLAADINTRPAVLFASLEPLIEPIKVHHNFDGDKTRNWLAPGGLDWVIVGGASGQQAPPCDIKAVFRITEQCQAGDTPCFVKQLGTKAYDSDFSDAPDGPLATWIRDYSKDPKQGAWRWWPSWLRVRQVPEIEETK